MSGQLYALVLFMIVPLLAFALVQLYFLRNAKVSPVIKRWQDVASALQIDLGSQVSENALKNLRNALIALTAAGLVCAWGFISVHPLFGSASAIFFILALIVLNVYLYNLLRRIRELRQEKIIKAIEEKVFLKRRCIRQILAAGDVGKVFLKHPDVDLGEACIAVGLPVASARSENVKITGDPESEPYDALPLYRAMKILREEKTFKEFGLACDFFDSAGNKVSHGEYLICARSDDNEVYLAVLRRGGDQVHKTRFLFLIEVTAGQKNLKTAVDLASSTYPILSRAFERITTSTLQAEGAQRDVLRVFIASLKGFTGFSHLIHHIQSNPSGIIALLLPPDVNADQWYAAFYDTADEESLKLKRDTAINLLRLAAHGTVQIWLLQNYFDNEGDEGDETLLKTLGIVLKSFKHLEASRYLRDETYMAPLMALGRPTSEINFNFDENLDLEGFRVPELRRPYALFGVGHAPLVKTPVRLVSQGGGYSGFILGYIPFRSIPREGTLGGILGTVLGEIVKSRHHVNSWRIRRNVCMLYLALQLSDDEWRDAYEKCRGVIPFGTHEESHIREKSYEPPNWEKLHEDINSFLGGSHKRP